MSSTERCSDSHKFYSLLYKWITPYVRQYAHAHVSCTEREQLDIDLRSIGRDAPGRWASAFVTYVANEILVT